MLHPAVQFQVSHRKLPKSVREWRDRLSGSVLNQAWVNQARPAIWRSLAIPFREKTNLRRIPRRLGSFTTAATVSFFLAAVPPYHFMQQLRPQSRQAKSQILPEKRKPSLSIAIICYDYLNQPLKTKIIFQSVKLLNLSQFFPNHPPGNREKSLASCGIDRAIFILL